MPDEIPPLSLGLGDKDERLVFLGPGNQATDMASLLRLAPGLASEAHALDLAQAVNHFAHETDYSVIEDPKAFADAYLAQIEREDPAAEWREGVIRLRDYGVPDFTQIEPPKFANGKLTFYAVDVFLGLPYKVEAANLEAAPSYSALPLTPLPRAPQPVTGDQEQEKKTPVGAAPATANVSANLPPPQGPADLPPLH